MMNKIPQILRLKNFWEREYLVFHIIEDSKKKNSVSNM